MGFRKAGSSDIVDVKQCPILVPHLEALLPEVRTCLSSWTAFAILGTSNWCMANNGPLMVLRHTAPLSKKDREKLERFSHSTTWRFSSRHKARYLNRLQESALVCVKRATLNVQPAGFHSGQ
jgi:tRNA/tmRNA/rRNA uracil-C5-methylase (TrmA/RlmC/RlmD family)